MRDKTVQVSWTNKSSSQGIKYSCIDMNQSMIESLDNMISYANTTVAIVLLFHKLWTNLFKTAKHLNSFVLYCRCYALTQRGARNTGVHRSWWVVLVNKSGNTDEYVNEGFLCRNREFGGISLASAYVLCP
jgi:hypothetical protein